MDSDTTDSRSPLLGRVAALIAALLIFIGGALVTLGLVVAAPIGVWAVHRLQRAREQTLGPGGAWVSSVAAVIVVITAGVGVIATRLPPGTWQRMHHAADSASAEAAKQPPPAWLSRLAPQQAVRPSPSAVHSSAGFSAFTMILGSEFLITLVGAVIGTVGWLGTMLLVYYASGHWPRGSPVVAVDREAVY